jgi:hypothetical protein
MKRTQSTSRHTRDSPLHWTLGALVTLVVLTLVSLVHALSSSVAQGADISAGTFPVSDNDCANESAQAQAFTPLCDKYQVEHRRLFDRAADLLDLCASDCESSKTSSTRRCSCRS